jgi:hypothetical protein
MANELLELYYNHRLYEGVDVENDTLIIENNDSIYRITMSEQSLHRSIRQMIIKQILDEMPISQHFIHIILGYVDYE